MRRRRVRSGLKMACFGRFSMVRRVTNGRVERMLISRSAKPVRDGSMRSGRTPPWSVGGCNSHSTHRLRSVSIRSPDHQYPLSLHGHRSASLLSLVTLRGRSRREPRGLLVQLRRWRWDCSSPVRLSVHLLRGQSSRSGFNGFRQSRLTLPRSVHSLKDWALMRPGFETRCVTGARATPRSPLHRSRMRQAGVA